VVKNSISTRIDSAWEEIIDAKIKPLKKGEVEALNIFVKHLYSIKPLPSDIRKHAEDAFFQWRQIKDIGITIKYEAMIQPIPGKLESSTDVVAAKITCRLLYAYKSYSYEDYLVLHKKKLNLVKQQQTYSTAA